MTSVDLTHNSPRGMRPVGGEVAELGHVDQLVVEHRWAAERVVDQDDAVLGGAVAVDEVDVEEVLGPGAQLGGDGRGARHRRELASAKEVLALLGHDLALDGVAVGAVGHAAVDLALDLLEQHLPDAGDEVELGGAHQREVVEQGGQVALGGEVGGAARAERGVQDDAAHDVADGHEVQRDRGQLALGVPVGAEPAAPAVGHQAVGVHGALGGAGAAGGVDQQAQVVVAAAGDLGPVGVPGALGDDVVEGLDGDVPGRSGGRSADSKASRWSSICGW